MSEQDYGALAQQARTTPAPQVDYDELAKQARSVDYGALAQQARAGNNEQERLIQPTWTDIFNGERKGFMKGVTAGWYDGSPTPAEATHMDAGDMVGSVLANAAPYALGPEAGIAANAAYAGLRETSREKEAGQGYSPAGIAAQTVLGGALSKIPGAGTLPTRILMGAGTGALASGLTQGVQQLTDTHTIDPGTLLPNMARGALTGSVINGAFGHPLPNGELGQLDKMGRQAQEIFAPHTISPESGQVGDMYRYQKGAEQQANAALQQEAAPFRKGFNKLTQQQRLDFMYNIDEGGARPTDQFLGEAHDFVTSNLDKQAKELQAQGLLDSVLEDYFPRGYKDPAKAAGFMSRSTGGSLAGAQPNMRQRVIPTLREALDPNQGGLELASNNPVDLFQQRMEAGERLKSAANVQSYMDQIGVRKFAPNPSDVPEGWVPEPGTRNKMYVNAAHERVDAGQSVVHPDVAPLLRNIVDQSAVSGPIINGLRKVGGLMNQFQLGLSAFHGGATAVNSYASKLPEIVQHLQNGEYGLAGQAALEAPFAPIVDFIRGGQLQNDVKAGAQNEMTEKLAQGGGRIAFDDPFVTRAGQAFKDAVQQGNTGNAVKTALPALLDVASSPIMKQLVPKLKLGAFQNLARGIDTSNMTGEEARAAMGQIWDSMDNRYGQLTHDNLFMSRTARALLPVLMRSPGWNIGTAKELGGGILDAAQGNLSNRAAYAASLPLTVGLAGGIYHYLHTGQMPQTANDYFYPKTGAQNVDGSDERMVFPSYLKDATNFTSHPIDTVLNKANPLISNLNELLVKNKDFAGTQIRNPADDASDQAAQVAKHELIAMTPFTVRKAMGWGDGGQMGRQGSGLETQAEQMFGLNAAPMRHSRSDAQNLAMQFLGDQTPQVRTPDEAAVSEAKRNVRVAFGKPNQQEVIDQAFASGLIRPDSIGKLAKQSGQPFFPGAISRLPPEQVLNIFEQATPEERQQIAPLLARQLRLVGKQPAFIRDALLPRMQTALQSLQQQPGQP